MVIENLSKIGTGHLLFDHVHPAGPLPGLQARLCLAVCVCVHARARGVYVSCLCEYVRGRAGLAVVCYGWSRASGVRVGL